MSLYLEKTICLYIYICAILCIYIYQSIIWWLWLAWHLDVYGCSRNGLQYWQMFVNALTDRPGKCGFPKDKVWLVSEQGSLSYHFGGDQTMQMYGSFERFPWYILFGLVIQLPLMDACFFLHCCILVLTAEKKSIETFVQHSKPASCSWCCLATRVS